MVLATSWWPLPSFFVGTQSYDTRPAVATRQHAVWLAGANKLAFSQIQGKREVNTLESSSPLLTDYSWKGEGEVGHYRRVIPRFRPLTTTDRGSSLSVQGATKEHQR
eukprot:1218829-Amphidinium_carterae.1